MKKIVIATNNVGKLNEIGAILALLDLAQKGIQQLIAAQKAALKS